MNNNTDDINHIIAQYGIWVSQMYASYHEIIVPSIKRSNAHSIAARNRILNSRLSWRSFSASLHEKQFRRMFRMTKKCFDELCECIVNAVGSSSFKNEDYLLMHSDNFSQAQYHSSGGCISGEIKLAITLRLLGGGSYLDVEKIFHIAFKGAHRIFIKVLKYWICNDNVIKINFPGYLNDETRLRDTAYSFSSGTSKGIISGCIGALDGWLVKIKCPSQSRDGIRNPGHYYSRKGFYALNVQVIVDKHKIVLWRCINSRGGSHDSSAFKNSSLYKMLTMKSRQLFDKGLYLIGDSAYSLRSFLLTPFDNAKPQSPEDAFNYYHSSCRIYVECTFGEIDMRWGIFWRPLGHKLENVKYIIDGAMRLHNFIVNYRRKHNINDRYDMDDFESECVNFITVNPNNISGVFGDGINDSRGRPTYEDQLLRKVGVGIRKGICDSLHFNGFSRPGQVSWRHTTSRHTRIN